MPVVRTLSLQVMHRDGVAPLAFTFDTVICGGYSGRNQEAIERHIAELRAHGLEAPSKTPIFFKVSTNLVSTETVVEVQGPRTSGEVEFVLLCQGAPRWVTVGSDHTDRELEKYSIAGSKQMYPKLLAPTVWPLEEVADHWDELLLRAWVHVEGERHLYQEDTLAAMLPPAQLLAAAAQEYPPAAFQQAVVFSGTIATQGGALLFGERFDVELLDPVLDRCLQHSYAIEIL
ncbi:MAG: hypothetical protein KatS3mg131_1867 [Candidatus Tectimicrobiota bacterium]|nr:MAG: hypothetical protein KatS3mg131_1867 [Candidatus Tectomicrobia bacterium]